jgi:rubredoxin
MAEVRSTITCPACGHHEAEMMPEDACQYFYKCKACGVVMRPQKGDCCVFCAYGDAKCPTAQRNTGGCRGMAARTGSWFVV